MNSTESQPHGLPSGNVSLSAQYFDVGDVFGNEDGSELVWDDRKQHAVAEFNIEPKKLQSKSAAQKASSLAQPTEHTRILTPIRDSKCHIDLDVLEDSQAQEEPNIIEEAFVVSTPYKTQRQGCINNWTRFNCESHKIKINTLSRQTLSNFSTQEIKVHRRNPHRDTRKPRIDPSISGSISTKSTKKACNNNTDTSKTRNSRHRRITQASLRNDHGKLCRPRNKPGVAHPANARCDSELFYEVKRLLDTKVDESGTWGKVRWVDSWVRMDDLHGAAEEV